MAEPRTYEVERIPFFLHWTEKSAFKETYAGAMDTVVVEGQHLKPKGSDSKTVLVFMHPTGTMNLLPMPNALAAAGMPCLTCGSRYPHNDTSLIMEKVILDLGQYIKYAKEKLGYEKVILAGWSGGGSLSMFYQSQAENPTIEVTPAGDPVDVAGVTVDAAALLPDERSYWRWDGSLTTPPCSEGVKWFMLREPVELSAAQIAAFKALYTGNARPVQPMNARKFIVGQEG